MKFQLTITIGLIIFTCLTSLVAQSSEGLHLVVLAGDDRMERLDESVSLIPALQNGLSKEKVIVIKSAFRSAHIGHWHDEWVGDFRGREVRDSAQGWASYDLIQAARKEAGAHPIESITIIWAQGAEDARREYAASYEASFQAVVQQLADDLGRDDINYVISRLAIHDRPERYPDLESIRKIHERLGDTLPRACWVDTDSAMAKSKNYSQALGQSLAKATLDQIHNNPSSNNGTLSPAEPIKEEAPAHLFLLSGQSNMANLDPQEAFIPTVYSKFGDTGAIVVKAAYGAKTISHWYDWKNANKRGDDLRNWLYRELIGKTQFAIANREIKSVTLCWMQGEADASAATNASAYADNFDESLPQTTSKEA
ncbi:MAG: sialate O-acetylesterase, partial [Verrucomicrobiota bacterium]